MPVTPKRLTKGVSSRGADDVMGMLPILDPTRLIYFFDDFVAAPDYAATTVYTGTWVDMTSQADGTITGLIGVKGGVVELNCQDSTDFVGLQTFNESFALTTGQQAWMGCRVRFPTDATNNLMKVGLGDISTDETPTRGIWFTSADGALTVTFEVFDTSSIATISNVGSLANNVWAQYEVYFDGVDDFKVYFNSAYAGTLTSSEFPTGALAPYIGMLVGKDHATSNKFQVDWIYAIQDR